MLNQYKRAINYFKKIILKELCEECNVWVAGGCVRDYFSMGYVTKDIDLFFPSEEEFNKCLKYLTDPFSPDSGSIEFENKNVIRVKYLNKYLDLVKKYFSGPEECIKHFDFTVCSAAIDLNKVYTHQTFFIDLARKDLIINSLPNPNATLKRSQKYIQRGFVISSRELKKISKEIDFNTEETEEEFY